MRRFSTLLIVCALCAVGASVVPGGARAATVGSIGFSADPTEDEAVTITVSGTSEADRYLYAIWQTGTSDCAATPDDEVGTNLTAYYGTAVGPGAYTKTFTTTPTTAGSYRLCAYIGTSRYVAPLATSSSVATVRLPTATVGSIGFSADPTEDEAVTITVSGTSEADRYLYAIWQTGTSDCAATPDDEVGTNLTAYYGTAVGPGAYTKTFTTTPTTAGSYRLCAYIGKSRYTAPLTKSSSVATVRLPTATVGSIGFSADPTEDEAVTITVSGTSEADRYLYAIWQTGTSDCAATPDDEVGTNLTAYYGTAVGPGAYTKTFTTTPTTAGSYRLCAYIGKSRYATPLTVRAGDVEVRRPSATIVFSGGPASYLSGDSLALTVSGDVERPSYYVATWGAGDVACSSEPLDEPADANLAAGSYSKPLTTGAGTSAAMTACVWIFDVTGGPPLAVGRFVVHKRPLETPTDLQQAVGADRRPTLTWKSAASGTDSVVLIKDGEPTVRITDAGAAPYQAVDFVQGEEGEDPDATAPKPDPTIARLVRRADGTTAVSFRRPLPPGAYSWRVARTRDPGESATATGGALRILGPPLRVLQVTTRRHRGFTPGRPGATTMTIRTTPYARVRLTLRRGERERVINIDWGRGALGHQRFDWSCKATGRPRYRYTVEAQDEQGTTLRRSGVFRTVTRATCRRLLAEQRRAVAERRAAELRRLRAQARREAAEQRARTQRFLHNCRALGGTPVTVERSFGTQIMCRGPYGGFLWVPY